MSKNGKRTILLGDFSYVPDSGSLYRDDQEVIPRLTRTQSRILECLYAHSNRTVSREELLKHAAGGRVVGEDNITQHIKKIRQALGDSASNPKYILTEPKIGYSFIATVKLKNRIDWFQHFLSTTSIISISLLIIGLVYVFHYDLLRGPVNRLPTPITSLKGQELDGDSTANGKYFVFSHKPLGKSNWNLIIKKSGEESYLQFTDNKFNDRRAKFSPSGNQLVYHHYGKGISQILLAQINWDENRLEGIEVLVDIGAGRLSVFMDWEDEETVYFSSSKTADQPYQISKINLNTRLTEVITSPPDNGHGDLAPAYSKESGKWAFLRNVGWSKTEILIYDPSTREISKIASVPLLLLSTAWNKQGKALIIRTGNGQLGEVSIKDGRITNILNSNSPVYAPFSVNEDSIGFMRGDLVVSDISMRSLEDHHQSMPIISSSFNDYLPAYAQNANSLAFVSTRSGQPQIWLRDKQNNLRQISYFKSSPKISYLALDKNAKYIAFSANAELKLMDIATGNILFASGEDNREYDNPVFSNDSRYLIYTVKYSDHWQLEKRSIDNMQIRTVLTEGYVAKPCEKEDCLYFIKHNRPMLYKLNSNGIVQETGVNLGNIQFVDQFYPLDDSIYFINKKGSQMKLIKHDLLTNKRSVIGSTRSTRFSLNSNERTTYWAVQNENDTNLESIWIK